MYVFQEHSSWFFHCRFQNEAANICQAEWACFPSEPQFQELWVRHCIITIHYLQNQSSKLCCVQTEPYCYYLPSSMNFRSCLGPPPQHKKCLPHWDYLSNWELTYHCNSFTMMSTSEKQFNLEVEIEFNMNTTGQYIFPQLSLQVLIRLLHVCYIIYIEFLKK